MPEPSHEEVASQIAATAKIVMLIGGIDTGKTTFARRILSEALRLRRTTAYVDADVGQTTVGPPACVGLKMLSEERHLAELDNADELRFVGSISPSRLVLQHVIATATLTARAAEEADLVVIDTTGAISGLIGETLKYHKMELCRPDQVVALQRGGELDPLVGMLRRFFSADITTLGVESAVVAVSPDLRASHRAARLAEAFRPPLDRWRVRPTVFAPTLPAGLDATRLDRMLVGVHDGEGQCLGLGVLEYTEDTLRVITNVGSGMQGLRLGSLRVDLDDFSTRAVNLREVMFGFEV